MEEFLGRRREEGRYDSEGTFTLNRRAAWRKVQNVLSEHPALFLLKLIQGLVGAGAETVSCQAGTTEIRLEGRGCQLGECSLIERLQGPAGLSLDDPGSDLALGLIGAIGQEFQEFSWQLGSGERAVFKNGQVVPDVRKLGSTRAVTFVFNLPEKHLLEALFDFDHAQREQLYHYLAWRLQYAPCTIRLGGQALGSTHFCPERQHGQGTVRATFLGKRLKITASYSYRYLARMSVYSDLPAASHTPPPMEGGPHFCEGKTPLAPSRLTRNYDCLLYLERFFDGREIVAHRSGRGELLCTVLLMAGEEHLGDRLLLVRRGACLANLERDVGDPRAVAVMDASEVDLDISTLKVVDNNRLQRLVRSVRHFTKHLKKELKARRADFPYQLESTVPGLSAYFDGL